MLLNSQQQWRRKHENDDQKHRVLRPSKFTGRPSQLQMITAQVKCRNSTAKPRRNQFGHPPLNNKPTSLSCIQISSTTINTQIQLLLICLRLQLWLKSFQHSNTNTGKHKFLQFISCYFKDFHCSAQQGQLWICVSHHSWSKRYPSGYDFLNAFPLPITASVQSFFIHSKLF